MKESGLIVYQVINGTKYLMYWCQCSFFTLAVSKCSTVNSTNDQFSWLFPDIFLYAKVLMKKKWKGIQLVPPMNTHQIELEIVSQNPVILR